MKKAVAVGILFLGLLLGLYGLVSFEEARILARDRADAVKEAETANAEATKSGEEEESAAGQLHEGGLEFESRVFSHEAEAGDAEMTATFVARNPGKDPVSLTKLDSSCSCLRVEADRLEIPPGGEATITAVFDIEKLSGEAEKSVYVTTDAPGAREVRLGVKVTIPAIVSLEPTTVKWAIGEAPEPREIRFRVLRDEPIRVIEATSSREAVEASLETIEEGREYRIVLTPKSTDETLLGFVRIVTDCELEQYQRQLAYFTVQNDPVKVD